MRSSMLHRATAGGINRSQCAPSTTAWIAVGRLVFIVFFFFQAEDGIRDIGVTGVQTCALPILLTGLYFVGYERATWPPQSPSVGATLQTGAQFLAMAFGPAAASWRASVAITDRKSVV